MQKRVDGHRQEDDGHRKIRLKRRKVSNNHHSAAGFHLPTREESSSDELSSSTLDVTQDTRSGDSKATKANVRGAEFSLTKTVAYEPGGFPPADDIAHIGDLLSSLGMTVTFPGTSWMHGEAWPSGLSV